MSLKAFFSGLCVGAADIVPGISGGTVAFIIGIYEELLQSISNIRHRWPFLSAFVLGAICSFLTLAKGFQYLLNDGALRPYLYSAFMGLVVGSAIFCARLLSTVRVHAIFCLFLGALSAYLISGSDLTPQVHERTFSVPFVYQATTPLTNYDPDKKLLLDVPQSQFGVMVAKRYIAKDIQVTDSQTGQSLAVEKLLETGKSSVALWVDLWVVLCGAMAISAMLLPGVSGSYLLNILGMYGIVLGALVDWIDALKIGVFDFASFRIVASMCFGIALGALVFSRIVQYLFNIYRELTIATLVGFMVGALRSVWPFWTYSYQLSPLNIASGPALQIVDPILPEFASSLFAISCLFFALGISTVFFIESLAKARKNDLWQQ